MPGFKSFKKNWRTTIFLFVLMNKELAYEHLTQRLYPGTFRKQQREFYKALKYLLNKEYVTLKGGILRVGKILKERKILAILKEHESRRRVVVGHLTMGGHRGFTTAPFTNKDIRGLKESGRRFEEHLSA